MFYQSKTNKSVRVPELFIKNMEFYMKNYSWSLQGSNSYKNMEFYLKNNSWSLQRSNSYKTETFKSCLYRYIETGGDNSQKQNSVSKPVRIFLCFNFLFT